MLALSPGYRLRVSDSGSGCGLPASVVQYRTFMLIALDVADPSTSSDLATSHRVERDSAGW